jgi:transcriptional regulator with XRE-family HTH domain
LLGGLVLRAFWERTSSTPEGEACRSRADIIFDVMTPGELVRATRRDLGLSQRQLALRAGMTQAAVSRIELGKVSPSFGTLRELMLAMGREPQLSATRLPMDWDQAHMDSTLARTPEQRLELAIGWNRLAQRLAASAERGRSGE